MPFEHNEYTGMQIDQKVQALDSYQHDGSSQTMAITVGSVAEEYAILKIWRPGFVLETQVLSNIEDRFYDILTMCDNMGNKIQLYFDISKFYGKSE